MSESTEEPAGISDEQLPEDLQPTDDNPLAQPLSEEDGPKSRDELDMRGGKTPDESDESDDTENGQESTESDA